MPLLSPASMPRRGFQVPRIPGWVGVVDDSTTKYRTVHPDQNFPLALAFHLIMRVVGNTYMAVGEHIQGRGAGLFALNGHPLPGGSW